MFWEGNFYPPFEPNVQGDKNNNLSDSCAEAGQTPVKHEAISTVLGQ